LISAELELFADYYAIAVGTTVNVNVVVTLEVLEAAPEDDSAEFDHVVEGSLQVPSGRRRTGDRLSSR
jgi:hypothetical protein